MLAPQDKTSPFPKNFVWGVATSAFQIEGGAAADGKGPSVWDDFCCRPGAIADGSDGRVACDHYHRLEEDLDLIRDLGVDAYRFSVSWPRVQPLGSGAFNEAGLAFYDRLVDGLLARGVKPYLTLNHWDLPLALQAHGGWAARDTVHRFVDYASHMAARLGDRVAAFTTHNEPWVISTLGYENGVFAPGLKDRRAAVQASHHLLLSHGLALQALRAQGCRSKLGIVLNLSPMQAATDSHSDHAKTRIEDGRVVRWYMDPLLKGSYPADVVEFLGADAPQVAADDLRHIATPMDFLGINYYTRQVVSAGEPFNVHDSGYDVTEMGWEVYPQGLTELLLRLHDDYALPPLYIKENGAAFKDQRVGDRVHDHQRRDYIADHIAAVGEALRRGVRLEGYMVWSLMDNFEWASGYEKRFGIIHVDYTTQQRTLKDSGLWYRDFIQRHKASHGSVPAAVATGA